MFLLLYSINSLVAFTLWDVGQYVYYNFLLIRLRRHEIEINLIFLIKLFFVCDQNQKVLTKT